MRRSAAWGLGNVPLRHTLSNTRGRNGRSVVADFYTKGKGVYHGWSTRNTR
jgi:hypothetical protein